MENDARRREGIEKIRELIEGIDYALLTTVRPDGSLHSRPMSTQQVEFDGDVWFFTKIDSNKVDEVGHDSRVNVSYADPDEQDWVSLSGRAEVVRDRRKMEELWNPALKAWFPDGLDDPQIALLKVTVDSGEYWKGTSSTVAYTVGLAKSLLSGEEYHPGENAEVKF